MSACPSDSSQDTIACLLRSISSNTVPDWNWDPLNFAVTAAIGILALVVALITVFQGVLAAGPGRLKASNLAIGPFSIHSKSRFDRSEIALRTTARVPLITYDVLYHRIVRQKYTPLLIDGDKVQRRHGFHGWHQGRNGQLDYDEEQYDGRTTIGMTSIDRRHQYDTTATWLTLLTALGLDDPTFFPLVQRVTDYLPADIQAAPAAAELRCLAILAVIADSNPKIERQDRLLRVFADSSQLVFREHPSLGQVAAYEAYEATAILKMGEAPPLQFGSRFPALRVDDLDRCIQLASGRLAYADGRIPHSIDGQPDARGFMKLVTDLVKRSGGCDHEICQNSFADWEETLSRLSDHRKFKILDKLLSVYMDISLLAAERANLCRGFPKQKLQLKQSIDDISSLCSFWSQDFTYQKIKQLSKLAVCTFWNSNNVPTAKMLSATWVCEYSTIQSTIRNPFEFASQRRWQYFKQDKAVQYMQMLRSWLARQRDEELNAMYERERLSSMMITQLLACMDEWLLRKGGVAASCILLKVLYKLGRQKGLLVVDRPNDLDEEENWDGVIITDESPISPTSKTFADVSEVMEKSPGMNGAAISPGQIKCGSDISKGDLITLLIFRGLLMAQLLDDGADTSLLFDHNFRNPIVKML